MISPTPTRSRRRILATLAAPLLGLLAAALTPSEARAQSYCPISQRDVVVFIADLDSPDHTWAQRQFYNLVEFGAEAAARLALGTRYRAVHVVKGSAATRYNFRRTLRNVAANRSILAVDLIFVTHGLSTKVYFSDDSVTMDTLRSDIVNYIPASWRAKFRMCYSTACYGSAHRSGWRSIGFETVSGSRRIHADAAISFPAFLAAWATNFTFQESVNFANWSDPARIQDNTAKGLLWSWGWSSWYDVDSYRYTSGDTWLRITHRPN